MTEKRFTRSNTYGWNKDGFLNTMNGLNKKNEKLKKENEELKKENQSWLKTASHLNTIAHKDRDYAKRIYKEHEQLKKENEQLKQDIENLIVTIKARETLIDVCEKKFKELGYIITVNDDGYVIE